MTNKRPLCPRCHRPQITCYCAIVTQVYSPVELVIWQHPSEQNHPKGTAHLLHLCLPNSRIFCGELATPETLHITPNHCRLLYPEADDTVANSADEHKPVTQLLVLDGTWRKSRKLLHLNPWLKTLPRLTIKGESSRYTIRKAEAEFQLSTFEAGVVALQRLTPSQPVTHLQNVLDQFVRRLQHFSPNSQY